jgi:hypothetical protein
LGNVITLGNAPPLASAFDLAQILAIHDPNLIAQYIADPNAILGAGVLGPVPFKFLNGVLVQGTPLGTNASAITQVISAAATYFFDPTQFALYSLEADPGSPFYQSLLLPSLQGVDHYLLSYRANGVWSSFFALDPLSQYDFAQGIDGIRFEAIDSGGDPFYIPNAFYFSMTFASDGVFSGQLSGLSIGVPEPATWSLLLVGFGSLGVFIRGRRRPAVPPDTKQISTSYMERQTAGRPQRRLH